MKPCSEAVHAQLEQNKYIFNAHKAYYSFCTPIADSDSLPLIDLVGVITTIVDKSYRHFLVTTNESCSVER